MPTEGFYNLAGNIHQMAGNAQTRLLDYYDRAWRNERLKDANWDEAIGGLKQRRAAKKAAKQDNEGALWGSGAGAALGLILAIPTGGASLFLLPAMGAAAGGTIGGAFDDPSGFNAQQFSQGVGQLAGMENPWFEGVKQQAPLTRSYNPAGEAASGSSYGYSRGSAPAPQTTTYPTAPKPWKPGIPAAQQ